MIFFDWRSVFNPGKWPLGKNSYPEVLFHLMACVQRSCPHLRSNAVLGYWPLLLLLYPAWINKSHFLCLWLLSSYLDAIRASLHIPHRPSTLLSAVKWIKKGRPLNCVLAKARWIVLMCTIYFIWNSRNVAVFESIRRSPNDVIYIIKSKVYLILHHYKKIWN